MASADNIISSGSAIVAGYGITNPNDDNFTASQCPSGVASMNDCFPELQNGKYGLRISGTIVESYERTRYLNETTPLDFIVYRVDAHTGYYQDFDSHSTAALEDLLDKTKATCNRFSTACNPNNKRLLYVTDKCKSEKSHAIRSGYVCGSDGKWDQATCRIAACEDGYVVDFDYDECVPNHCSPKVTPSPSASSSSSSPLSPSSHISSSTTLEPITALICALAFLFLLVF